MKSTLPMLVLTSMIWTSSAAQQNDLEYGQDYYSPKQPGLIKSVEAHHLAVGVQKMRDRNYGVGTSGAFGDFKYILDYFPNHPQALSLMGEVSLLKKRPREGEEYFEKALSLYPQYASTHLVYGVFLHRQGKLDEATKQYQEAVKLDPNSRDAHYNLGLAYLAQKNLEAANQHAQLAYGLGYPLPGLRNKLTAAGAWKPLPNEQPADEQRADGDPLPTNGQSAK